MTSTSMPFIELPFPARLHPESARIETSARNWVMRFHLVRSDVAAQKLVQSRFGGLAAYAHPAAPLPEAELAGCFYAWLHFTDDQYEEGAYGSDQRWTGVTDAVREALDPDLPTGPLADTPLIRAFAALSGRFDALASPAWKKRFARHMMDTMAGALREIQLREGGIPPPLAEYAALRRDTGTVLPSFDLIEVCAHTELPAEIYHSPVFQEIVLAGVDIICWTNDLYSLDKEIACGIVSNLVLVLQHERHLNREQAFTAARALTHDRVNDFLAAEQRLPELVNTLQLNAAAQETAHRYVAGIRDWIAGSNQWHAYVTARFQQPTPGTAAPSPVEDLLRPTSS